MGIKMNVKQMYAQVLFSHLNKVLNSKRNHCKLFKLEKSIQKGKVCAEHSQFHWICENSLRKRNE